MSVMAASQTVSVDIELAAAVTELLGLLLQAGDAFSVAAQILADAHGAELGSAHGTEMRDLVGLLGQASRRG